MTSGAELERRKAGLSAQQRAALQERIRGGKQHSKCSIPPVSRSSSIPLSFAQERIWLHGQLVPESVVYNRPSNIRLLGPLQTDILIRALRYTVSRHESIWMTVEAADAAPTLKVQPPCDLDVPFTDLTHEPDVAARALEVAKEEAERPFNLNQIPLLRSHLLRMGDDEHLLLLTFHHFCFDAWSQAVLLRELSAAYEKFSMGVVPDGNRSVIHYADFAAWDRSDARVSAFAEGRRYWKREVDAPPTLQLPTDYSRSTERSEAAGHLNFELTPVLVQGIRDLARSEGTTFFAAVLAAFQTLLHRYSGESDLVVGCPFAGRTRVESEELIGVFINTLPLRATISEGDTFRQLMRRTGRTVLAGLSHQEVPLQFIVQDVLADRDTSGSPLFQAMFIHERLPVEPRASAGVTFEPEDRPAPATMVDLSLEIVETAGTVTGRMNYRVELWEQSTIERMVAHFVTLLEGITANAGQRLSELPLLTEPEREQLLIEWNDTAVEYPRDKCIHELVEQQVTRTPDAVAVVFEDQQLTYRELNQRANQLAHHLMGLGVGPETLVGLCLERSAELVVGILGILKAGGAYVPLGADYPRKRLEFVLHEAAVGQLVTQTSLLDRLPTDGRTVTCIDMEAARLKTGDCSNPTSGVVADNLAYVMYTSGSTGQPKGVAIPQSAVVNFLLSMAAQPGMTSDDRILGVATPTFDTSVLELLLPLTVGASLDVLPSSLTGDGEGLAAYVSNRGATVMQATPATWQMLLQSGWRGGRHLKVLCGGEALSDQLAEELHQRCGELWNMYGPTETTVWSITRCVAREGARGVIGRPIANIQVYVLDAQCQPVPIGVSGELYIGGAGRARGYLNRPDLTAERFVANPFSDDSASRLYRTGDLCRWRADGNLEFLGRFDDQVKLRGFRIELGEIETVLSEHPDVAQSVVILREDRPGDKRLVAYCVPSAETELHVAALRSHLRNRLPGYMVPTVFVVQETLPLTSTGKINRRALPAPDDSRPELETGYVAPRNPIEEQLAAIWCEVLSLEKAGIRDNFFALGGHSLLATRVNVRITTALQVDLPLRRLFEAPTIAELSSEIETLRSGGLIAHGIELQRVDREQLMVPAAFVVQETLPLTSSGKINRHALLAPDDSRPELETGYVAPRNLIEQQLASIWCEVLGIETIGIHDNFFALGGHSLLAVRLFARIETAVGRKLSLAVLFQHGTIGHLAKLLVESHPALEMARVIPLQPEGDGRPLFLMPSMGGELLFSQALLEAMGSRFPLLGIQPSLAAENPEQWRDFRATARCFVDALQACQPHGPYALAGYSYGGLMAFEVACLLTELGETVDLLVVIDTGPGRRGLKPQFGGRARRTVRILANLPLRLREESRQFSARQFSGRVYRKLRRFYRHIASGGRTERELDDFVDESRIPPQKREIMRTAFAAFRDYVPRPYAGKLTLIRTKAQAVLSGLPRDLGWGQLVDTLDIRQVNGDHWNILEQPHVGELARQLTELMDDVAPQSAADAQDARSPRDSC